MGEEDGNDALLRWIKEFEVEVLVVDFPLSYPSCYQCSLVCPGIEYCTVDEVQSARQRINTLLKEDTSQNLSRSLNKKLKKRFLPYWNRTIDIWIWENYYDLLLHYFSVGFESFGNTSMMLLSRFSYLRRHFAPELACYETSPLICLLELLYGKIITKKQIVKLKDIEEGAVMRMEIIKAIEDKLKVFIYNHDFNLMTENPRAFLSFILAVAGQKVIEGETVEVPPWCYNREQSFFIPKF